MKKYYKYGEMILALRQEYMECKHLLDELNKCINVKSENSNFYFTGLLSEDKNTQNFDRKVRLIVEKRYLDILKKIQYLKYNWYTQFLSSAIFITEKKDDGLYDLKYGNILTPVDGRKYIPEVEVINQTKFSQLIDELFSTDLMQLKAGYFSNNYDNISLNFDYASIRTPLGDDSFISWNGKKDIFNYSITRHNSPLLLEEILSLEIPVDKISSDWLRLLEKHENILGKEVLFDVDINAHSKKGILQVSDLKISNDKSVVKLLKNNKRM